MKYVLAIIRPHKFEAVREALDAVGVEDIIVVEIKRYGHDSDHKEFYRGHEFEVKFLPKIKIEFAVSDDLADEATRVLREAAFTGETGDGRVFVLDVFHSIQIKTGKIDATVDAL